jgi:hypothetical protein
MVLIEEGRPKKPPFVSELFVSGSLDYSPSVPAFAAA